MTVKKEVFRVPIIMILVFVLCTFSLFSGENPLKVTEIQENLYLISGLIWDINVVFLVTEDGVLVVDSGNDHMEGQWIVEKIKEKTSQPIKTVILTHYHFDHSLGLMGFPKGTTIIAHSNCDKNISKMNESNLKWYIEKGIPQDIQEREQNIEKLKKEKKAGIEKEERELQVTKEKLEFLKNHSLVYPSLTFTDKIMVKMGQEKIQVIYPGNAHTNGNVFVYLPHRKLAIMGDLLFYKCIPYIDWHADSNTQKWIEIMEQLSQWDIETVVPGHGEVTDKKAFELEKKYLTELRQIVEESVKKGKSLEEMKKSIQLEKYKQWNFYNFFPGNIEAIVNELKR